MEIFKIAFQPIILIIGFIVGLYQYNKQQKFKRLQNLSALWKNFADNEQLLNLFNLMDEIENDDNSGLSELENYKRGVKLKYLALIEEASLYITEFEVDKKYARYLFQWHFYFPYKSPKTSDAFWKNLGGQAEMNANYWQMSRGLSAEFKP